MLAYGEWYVSRTNQIAALGYVYRTNQSVVFILWFERSSNFNEELNATVGEFPPQFSHVLTFFTNQIQFKLP